MGRRKHTSEGMLVLAMATSQPREEPREALATPVTEAPPPPGALIRAAKEEMRHLNNFLMDTENWLLEWKWPSEGRPHPGGRQRFEDPRWAELMQESLEDSVSATWEVYTAWVQGGGGDEWFVEE